jgi:hypothetical protein
MKKQLTIFQRQHCNGVPCSSYLLAAWHWKWSLTWRWILSWSKWYAPPGRQGFTFMRTHRGRGFNFTTGLNLPLIGHFSFQTQPNMLSTPHPLAGLHINQGSLDAAADAYEAEYNKAHGIETPNAGVKAAAEGSPATEGSEP